MITVTRNGRLVTIPVAPEPPPTVVARFGLIMKGLMKSIGERSGKIPDAILVHIYYRIHLILTKFTALAARVEAGLVRPYRPRQPREADEDPAASGEKPPPPPPDPHNRPAPFPRQWAWEVRYVPYSASAFGSQLAALLNDPDMAKLLARSPGLRRMLRPLMRALAQPPHPVLRDPPREARPATPKPVGAEAGGSEREPRAAEGQAEAMGSPARVATPLACGGSDMGCANDGPIPKCEILQG
jgi:hypothetical protein